MILDGNNWAGADSRVISVNVGKQPIFGEHVADIIKWMNKHYGWIGEKFISVISRSEVRKKIEGLHRAFIDEFHQFGYTGKQSLSAAACLTADTIACEYVFEDQDDSLKLTVDDLIPYLTKPEETRMGRKMMEFVRAWVVSNSSHFVRPARGPSRDWERYCQDEYQPNCEIYGKFKPNGYVAIIPQKLKGYLEAKFGRASLTTFENWADEQGLLQRDEQENRPTKNERYPDNMQVRSLVINFDKSNEEESQAPSTSEDALLNIFPTPNGDAEDKGEDGGQQLSMEGVCERNDEGKLSA